MVIFYDLKFAQRTEEALWRYEEGLFKSKSSDAFLRDLDKW